MEKILVTGGAGFIGSHVAEFYAQKGEEVIVFDNLSRGPLLNKNKNFNGNKEYLTKYDNIQFIEGDIRNLELIEKASKGVEVIIHTAAQTAVTTSVLDPKTDFEVNALGTFNVLEAARKNNVKSLVYCSTNKVYGDNVNKIRVIEKDKKYIMEKKFEKGIPESFDIDLCEHTPYGCSKLTGDLYVQDYAHLFGIKTGVFRMSCIYGTRQFGVEDQGWVAWFAIATLLEKPLTIFGDGKQVRDVLYVTDLVEIYDKFLNSDLDYGVFNTGGGYKNTLSLLELLDILEDLTGKRSKINYSGWRPSDQKVYISDITKARDLLKWEPKVNPKEGVENLVNWVQENIHYFN